VRVRHRRLRRRNPDDDFARLGALEIFAGDFFDQAGIGLERANLIAEFEVLLIQTVQILFDSVDFVLRAAHGDKAVRAEDVMNDEGENEESEDGAAVMLKKCAESRLRFGLLQFFSTHSVASRARRADAAALSAST